MKKKKQKKKKHASDLRSNGNRGVAGTAPLLRKRKPKRAKRRPSNRGIRRGGRS
jgi:hypothetical protein